MGLDDILGNPGFWLLGGGGVAAEVLGWKLSRGWAAGALPFWQLLVLIVGTLIAAAFFASRE